MLNSVLAVKFEFEEMTDEDADEERQELIGRRPEDPNPAQLFKTFKRRWLVLLLFSLLSFLQVSFPEPVENPKFGNVFFFLYSYFLPALVYESAEQKPKHCQTWNFQQALVIGKKSYT